jgi:hypothetical protein
MKIESFGFIAEGKGLFTEVSDLDLIDVGGACGGGGGGDPVGPMGPCPFPSPWGLIP